MSNDDINIKVKASMSNTTKELGNLTSGFKRLGDSAKNVGGNYGKFINDNKKLNNSFQNMSRDVNRSTNSIGKMGQSLFSLSGIIKGVGIYGLGNQIADAIQSNVEMIETVHLFEVAMGDFAESTDIALKSMSGFLGLDHTNLQNRVATYNLLARSMGMSSENASVLSTNMNQLANDMASLTNTSITQMSEDIRSGLIGQSRTMYKYGVDVTESAIKVEALNQGITKSVRVMTQGEKMALRYAVMIRQTGLAHGDFANTINTPANQLKIMAERFVTLTRSIGSLFIPMLTAVLPFINAVLTALTNIVNVIAKLIGAEPISLVKNSGAGGMGGSLGIDDDGLGDTDSGGGGGSKKMADGVKGVASGADKASKAVGKTEKAVKKLKSALGGFDEINVLGVKDNTDEALDKAGSDPSGGSGSGKGKGKGAGGAGAGGAGGGGGSPFDTALTGYDSMFDTVTQQSDAMIASIQKGLELLLKLIGLIAIAFLSWKISNLLWLALPLLKKALAGSLAILMEWIKEYGFLKAMLILQPKLAWLALMTITLTVMITRFIDLYTKSELFRLGLKTVWDFGKWMFDGLIKLAIKLGDEIVILGKATLDLFPDWVKKIGTDFFTSLSYLAEKLDLDVSDILITMLGFALLSTPFGTALLVFEALTVALRLLGYGASDAVDEIDWLGAGISEATLDKLEPFRAKLGELNTTIDSIHFGNIKIDDEVIADMGAKLKEMSSMIISELDADQNEALKKLEPLRDALGEEAYAKLIKTNTDYYDGMKKKVADNEAEILNIMKTHQDENGQLTQEGYDKIQAIKDESNNIGLKHISESETEYNAIMNTLKDNATRISLEQAQDLIQNSLKTKDETIKNAELQFSGIELEMQRMMELDADNAEYYQSIIDSAKEAKDKTVADANSQYNDITKATKEGLGENAKFIDTTTGEMKTKWEVWSKSLVENWDTSLDNIKKFGKEKMEELKKNLEEIWDKIGIFFSKKVPEITGNIVKFFTELPSKIGYAIGFVLGTIARWVVDMVGVIIREVPKILSGIVNIISKIPAKSKEKLDLFKATIKTWVSDSVSWIKQEVPRFLNSVVDNMGKLPGAMVNIGKNMIKGLWNGIISVGSWLTSRMAGFFGGLWTTASDLFGRVGSGSQAGYSAPRRFARGGKVSAGEIFEAGEFGKAELVGSYGGQTTVMPLENSGFVDAMERAVVRGVSSAMKGGQGGEGTPIIVNVGGKTLVDTVVGGINRESRIKGKTIITV